MQEQQHIQGAWRRASNLPLRAARTGACAVSLALALILPAGCQASSVRVVEKVEIAPISDRDLNWQTYRGRFLQPDGRIVDTFSGVTHTEGQGTGMVLSALAGDRASFDLIWTWTRENLQSSDGLSAWRYDPSKSTPVEDPNNATDGDIFIAWGLLLAADTWNDPSYKREGLRIARAVEKHLVARVGDRVVLVPGREGFAKKDGVVVNLSYYVFPALDDLARLAGSPLLKRVADDGAALIAKARFGALALPSDWVLVTAESVKVAPNREPRFGYEVIRVPLYLVWGGRFSREQAASFCAMWSRGDISEPPPGWIDLETGAQANYRGSNGFLAVKQLVLRSCALPAAEGTVRPTIRPEDDYYAASLVAFSALAHTSLSGGGGQ